MELGLAGILLIHWRWRSRLALRSCHEVEPTALAVVTGGSKGIGLETARGLARDGVRVMICAPRRSVLAEAAEDIHKTTGGKVETYPLDVTDHGAIGELPKVIQQKLGGIDLLVNNAGTGTYKPFLEVTDDELQYGMA